MSEHKNNKIDFESIKNYWLQGSQADLKAAEGLLKLKHYSHCLFFCHLALEKILKAIFVAREKKHAPYIHDLIVLAKKSGILLSQWQRSDLEIITGFNIQGRYADYKSKFYKLYNRYSYASKYLEKTKKLLLCLKNELQKK